MNYSQKPLIDLFKSGNVFGEEMVPKHIETVISNVFLFEQKVYKFYKNDSEFFNNSFRDISTKEARFAFTKKDFKWNNSLTPSVYLELKGVIVKDNQLVIVPEEEAEELVIVMNRIQAKDVLYEKLIHGELSQEDCYSIGKQLGEKIKGVQTGLSQEYNFYEMFESRIADVRDWVKSVTEYISIQESGSYCDYLERFRQENKEWFGKDLSKEVNRDGDFHSHNAVYSGGSLYLMDTYPPKEEWGIGHRLTAMYRIGTDIWALSEKKEYFDSFVQGYEEGYEIKINHKLNDFYIVYASSIMVPYLYMLQQTDPDKKDSAEKYHAFIRNYFSKLN